LPTAASQPKKKEAQRNRTKGKQKEYSCAMQRQPHASLATTPSAAQMASAGEIGRRRDRGAEAKKAANAARRFGPERADCGSKKMPASNASPLNPMLPLISSKMDDIPGVHARYVDGRWHILPRSSISRSRAACLFGLPSLSFHALRDQLNRWRFSSFYQPMVPPTPATQQSLLSTQNAKARTRVTKTAEWV